MGQGWRAPLTPSPGWQTTNAGQPHGPVVPQRGDDTEDEVSDPQVAHHPLNGGALRLNVLSVFACPLIRTTVTHRIIPLATRDRVGIYVRLNPCITGHISVADGIAETVSDDACAHAVFATAPRNTGAVTKRINGI